MAIQGNPSNPSPYTSGTPSTFAAGVHPRNVGSVTDVGYVREHNEDNLLVKPPLFAVCDGMGGHNAGEVASAIAIDVLCDKAPMRPDASGLEAAVNDANMTIIRAVAEGEGREGMGTTCTAAILEGERLVIAQVGDSRAYLLHAGQLQQLTRDHSLVADLVDQGEITPEEARNHPWRSYITRALGLDPRVQPDIYELNVHAGDRLMLCSDGLYSMIPDSDIASIMQDADDPQLCAQALTQAALDAGGSDNITVIVVDAAGNSEKLMRKAARKTKVTAAIVIGILIAIIIGCAIAFNVVATNSAYLGVVDGHVAIYRGIPGDVAGITFSTLDQITDIAIDDVQPGTARRIANGDIRCASLQDARDLVNGYRQDIEDKSDALSGNGEDAADTAEDPASQADQQTERVIRVPEQVDSTVGMGYVAP